MNKITCATRTFRITATSVISVPMLTAQSNGAPPPRQPAPQTISAIPVPVPLPAVPDSGFTVNIGVPAFYVWDGSEYIGFIGDQYYFLAPGNLWLPLSGNRLNRFRAWEKDHHDWRSHAIRNERFRRDAQGKMHLWTNDDANDNDHHGH
jgi:hypothetical protein